MRKPLLGPILVILLFISMLGCPALIAQQELDNAAVIKMTKAGLGPEIVAASVKSRPGHYDASPDGLDRKSTRLNSSHQHRSRMPSSA